MEARPKSATLEGSGTETAEKLRLSMPRPSSAPGSLKSFQRSHKSVPGVHESPETVAVIPATLPAEFPSTLAAVVPTTGATKPRAETDVTPGASVQSAVVAVRL